MYSHTHTHTHKKKVMKESNITDIQAHSNFITIIIIIIYHQLGFDRPVSSSSNSLFEGLPSHLCPFGLQFSVIFCIPLLFILVKSRIQFDLYFRSFLSTGSTFSSSKISSFLLWSKKGVHPPPSEKFHLD